MVERFRVGVIASTHGLKGEVKIFPTTDDPGRFEDLDDVTLVTRRGEEKLRIRSVKYFKNFVILGFEGKDRIEDVERLRGAELMIDRKDAIPLGEGEHYIPDLIGLDVIREEDGSSVGKLTDVLFTGANDVYVVRTPEGKDLLIPAIPQCIKDVNVEEGFMKVWLMPGLEDL